MVSHQNHQTVMKNKPRRRPVGDDNRSISTKSTTSSKSSTSSKKKKPKMKFDINTSQYVPVPVSQNRVDKFRNNMKKITKECKFHNLNEDLNKYSMEKGDLFSEKNLTILRYSFFKGMNNDYEDILRQVREKENDEPKLKYVKKLKKNKNRERGATMHLLPSILTDNLLSDQPLQGLGITPIDSLNESEEEDIIDEYLDPKSVKECIKSNQFWNNVYQELRFNLLQFSSTYNYFDLLPGLNVMATFYKELIEYFLLNINELRCHTSGLSESEIANVKQHRFLYFRDFDYDWFRIMSDLHYGFFDQQAKLSSTISINHDHDFSIHKNLVTKMLDTVMENLRNSLSNEFSDQLDIWDRFLRYLIFEVVIKHYSPQNSFLSSECLPEPNLDRSRSNSYNSLDTSFDQSIMSSFTSTDEVNQLTKNTKNLSLNLGSVSPGPISIIEEDTEEFTYKRRGFVIEPPTPRDGVFTTPLSSNFSVNSDDTKLYSSKRLIFSRLRRKVQT